MRYRATTGGIFYHLFYVDKNDSQELTIYWKLAADKSFPNKTEQ